jgi:hypothetical protein
MAELVSVLTSLEGLQTLELWNVDDTLPLSLLTGLRALELHRIKYFPIEGLQSLTALTKLKTLIVSNEPLAVRAVQALAGMTTLQSLRLEKCDRLSCLDFRALTPLTRLQSLELYCTWADLRGLAPFVHLKSLKVDIDELSNESLLVLGSLPMLQELSLGDCSQLTVLSLQNLRSLGAVRRLRLRSCKRATDEVLGIIASLTTLQTLEISGCKFTSYGIQTLTSLTNLFHLCISCPQMSIAGADSLLSLPKLEFLELIQTSGDLFEKGVFDSLSAIRKFKTFIYDR